MNIPDNDERLDHTVYAKTKNKYGANIHSAPCELLNVLAPQVQMIRLDKESQ